MSGVAVKWARKQLTAGPVEKSVLFVLAVEADRSGVCSLSSRRIAQDAGTDRATAWRILARLADRGLVKWTEGTGRKPNTYQLQIDGRPP
ncbi:MAG: Rrf2 family transcriptional regulator [Pseudonocardiales bacterium]|nr:Rrf2 family transcriptional regulator [Pseudonocardiales bacterium]